MSTSEPREKLSKTPSWIMVGFVLGVLAVLGFQHELRRNEPPAPAGPANERPVPEAPPANVTALTDQPSLAVIEAVFAEWGGYALWEDERTEVALWNSTTGGFTDFFEVVRLAEGYYFRSIPQLTRPLTEAVPPSEAPLRFTEPESQRRARREGRLSPQEPAPRTGPWRPSPGEAAPARPQYLPPPPPPKSEPQV